MEIKECTKCKTEKPLSEFNKSGFHPSGKPKTKSRCKLCVSAADSLYNKQEEVREKVRESSRKRRERYLPVREKFYNFLRESPCVDCGESDILFLECDHVRGEKTMSIGQMMGRTRPWEEIEEEIKKCEVRCVRCHRLVTASRGNWTILKYR